MQAKTEKKQATVFDVRKFETMPEFAEPAPETGAYLLTTNSPEIAASCLSGSRVPMAIYKGRKFVASNFSLIKLRALQARQPAKVTKKKVAAPRRRQGGPR